MTAPAHRSEPREEPRTQRVWCQAELRTDLDRPRMCGMELGDVPLSFRFVRVTSMKPEPDERRIRLKCGRASCRMWNVFELAEA